MADIGALFVNAQPTKIRDQPPDTVVYSRDGMLALAAGAGVDAEALDAWVKQRGQIVPDGAWSKGGFRPTRRDIPPTLVYLLRTSTLNL